jgi:DNA-binding Lrp family transcriptional regulator
MADQTYKNFTNQPFSNVTKKKAYDALSYLSEKQKQIVMCLKQEGDLTRAELAIATGMRVSSVCGRVNELLKINVLKISGTKEDEESKRMVECISLVNED